MADKDYPINELVRVRIGSGKDAVEKNMGRALAEASDDVEILDEPTHGLDGRMLDDVRARPSKPKTTVAGAAAAKKAASSATDEKE